jgi:hypothetical protein
VDLVTSLPDTTDVARCASCKQEVAAGRFCEVCGAPLEAAPAPAPASFSVRLAEVNAFRGRDDPAEIVLDKVRTASGIVATSTRADEGSQHTFAGSVRLVVSVGGSSVDVATEGLGMITFTDRRVLGVLTDGKLGEDQRLHVSADGHGVAALFTADRRLFDEVEVRAGRGKTNGVALTGAKIGLVLDGYASMTPDGSFTRTDNADLVAVARRFAAAPPATEETPEATPTVEVPVATAAGFAPERYRNLAAILRRVAPASDLEVTDIGVTLRGKHPLPSPHEREIARYGAVVGLIGGRSERD